MSEHVEHWLTPYHDGELNAAQRAEVDQHLATCSGCQNRLAELQSLSSLLRAAPLPADIETADAFARRLVRQLPPHPAPTGQRALETLLRYLPGALFAGWAFFQAAGWMAGMLMLGLSFFPKASGVLALLQLLPSPSGLPLQLNLLSALGGNLTTGQPWLDILAIFIMVSFALTVITAALFSGWLATWWAFVQDKNKENQYGSHANFTTGA